MKTKHLCIIWFIWMFAVLSSISLADHLGPERIVDNKYLVILGLNEKNKTMDLTFHFRDIKTGKNIETPLKGTLEIEDDDTKETRNKSIEVTGGIGTFSYAFPVAGIYKIHVTFAVKNDSNVYTVDPWTIWVPGEEKNDAYTLGFSELVGIGLLVFMLLFAALNYWLLRKKPKS